MKHLNTIILFSIGILCGSGFGFMIGLVHNNIPLGILVGFPLAIGIGFLLAYKK